MHHGGIRIATAVLLGLASSVLACSGGDDDGGLGDDVTMDEVLDRLDEHVAFVELSDDVGEYYADLYFDGGNVRFGDFDGGQVLVAERDGGFETDELERLDDFADPLARGDERTMVDLGDVVVLIVADAEDAAVSAWLEG